MYVKVVIVEAVMDELGQNQAQVKISQQISSKELQPPRLRPPGCGTDHGEMRLCVGRVGMDNVAGVSGLRPKSVHESPKGWTSRVLPRGTNYMFEVFEFRMK